MEQLKIDDVAKATGLTKRSIRYYEEIGLIPPPLRSEGGTRKYTPGHVARLKRIINAREVLGFSLQELLEFIAIEETVERGRSEYRSEQDPAVKRSRLEEIGKGLENQLRAIRTKINKLRDFEADIQCLLTKVQDASVGRDCHNSDDTTSTSGT